MYQQYYPCGAHNAWSFGLLWITTIVPDGDKGVQLKLNSLNIWVKADMRERFLDCLIRFRLNVACCKSLSHNWRWKSLFTLHSLNMMWFLNVCIYLSELFALLLLGGTNWYLIFMVIIVRFKGVDASLSIKWKPGSISWILKSSVHDLKALIVSL